MSNATELTTIDTFPTWATHIDLEEDGYVYFMRSSATVEGGQLQQVGTLVVDADARTLTYQPRQDVRVSLPHSDNFLTVDQAWETFAALEEILPILEQAESSSDVEEGHDRSAVTEPVKDGLAQAKACHSIRENISQALNEVSRIDFSQLNEKDLWELRDAAAVLKNLAEGYADPDGEVLS